MLFTDLNSFDVSIRIGVPVTGATQSVVSGLEACGRVSGGDGVLTRQLHALCHIVHFGNLDLKAKTQSDETNNYSNTF